MEVQVSSLRARMRHEIGLSLYIVGLVFWERGYFPEMVITGMRALKGWGLDFSDGGVIVRLKVL